MPAATNRVFVVDDDDAVRHSLRALLEAHGYQVDTYSLAADFLAGAKDNDRGCLLLDYWLPDASGFDVLEMLRARSIDLPTILITGVLDPGLEERARRMGVRCVLRKPWDCAELFRLIDQAQQERPTSIR
jgi:FixJ family two-component response regulator